MQSSLWVALIRLNSQVIVCISLYLVVRSPSTGSLTFATLTGASSGFWQLSSPGITVNGKSTSALKKTRTFIFDSGTSNIVLPQAEACSQAPLAAIPTMGLWLSSPSLVIATPVVLARHELDCVGLSLSSHAILARSWQIGQAVFGIALFVICRRIGLSSLSLQSRVRCGHCRPLWSLDGAARIQ